MQDKIFIRIAKPFTISQRNDNSSSTKELHIPAVSVSFKSAILNLNQDQEQFEKRCRIKIPNTKQVSGILYKFTISEKEYCTV